MSSPARSTTSLLSIVRANLGPMLVGTLLGAIFLGITFLQTVFYYKTYRKDTLFLKLLVGVLCVLDTLSLILWVYSSYWFLVFNFGDLAAVASVIWSEAGEPVVTGVIAFSVHLFLIWRIQLLDARWRVFCIALVIASFVSFLATIAATVIISIGMQKKTAVGVVNTVLAWCGLVGDVCSVVVDLGIAASISYLLHHGRGKFDGTNRLLNSLTMYIVSNGLITTVFRLVELVLAFKYPTELYVLIPYIPTSKAYTNALLATLNSRASRRQDFSSGVETDIEWRGGGATQTLEWIGMSATGDALPGADSECWTKAEAKPYGTHLARSAMTT